MTRVEKLREYRSRLIQEVDAKIDAFIADGRPAMQALALSDHIAKVHQRAHLIDLEVDKEMEKQLQHA